MIRIEGTKLDGSARGAMEVPDLDRARSILQCKCGTCDGCKFRALYDDCIVVEVRPGDTISMIRDIAPGAVELLGAIVTDLVTDFGNDVLKTFSVRNGKAKKHRRR